MSIVIRNLGGDPLGECSYEIRINERVITTFKHNRVRGLSACLRQAADAVDKSEWTKWAAIFTADADEAPRRLRDKGGDEE